MAGLPSCSLCRVTWIILQVSLNYPNGKPGRSAVLCQADAEGLNSWKNFDPSAPWVSTCWTPQSWHLFPGKSPCKLFSDIPGASAVMCSLDFMHNKYLGVDMYIFGSCLHLDTFQQCFAFGLLLPAFLHP